MKQNENRTTLPLEMRVNRLDTQGGSCLAHLSMTLGECFAVRGIRLMEGKNGPFLSFPSYKAKDGYQDICFPPERGAAPPDDRGGGERLPSGAGTAPDAAGGTGTGP